MTPRKSLRDSDAAAKKIAPQFGDADRLREMDRRHRRNRRINFAIAVASVLASVAFLVVAYVVAGR